MGSCPQGFGSAARERPLFGSVNSRFRPRAVVGFVRLNAWKRTLAVRARAGADHLRPSFVTLNPIAKDLRSAAGATRRQIALIICPASQRIDVAVDPELAVCLLGHEWLDRSERP